MNIKKYLRNFIPFVLTFIMALGFLSTQSASAAAAAEEENLIIANQGVESPYNNAVPCEYRNCGNCLQIIKVDSINTCKYLKGAVFQISKTCDFKHYKEITTNSNGFAGLKDLESGIYFVKEVKAPEGYIPYSTVEKIRISKCSPTLLVCKNTPYSKATIKKVDECGKPLANAVFSVYEGNSTSGKLIAKDLKTDVNGLLTIPNLVPNKTYTFVETKAPDGYHLDANPVTKKIEAGKDITITFTNKKIKDGYIKIIKLDAATDEPLEGAKIAIYNGKECNDNQLVDQFTSSKTPYVSKGLKPGTYYVKELSAPNNYQRYKATITVEVKEEQTTTVKIYNHQPPVTAGNYGTILLAGIVLVVLSSASLIVYYRRKKHEC